MSTNTRRDCTVALACGHLNACTSRACHLEVLGCTLTGRTMCCYLLLGVCPTIWINNTCSMAVMCYMAYIALSCTPQVQYCISHMPLTAMLYILQKHLSSAMKECPPPLLDQFSKFSSVSCSASKVENTVVTSTRILL